MPEMSLGRALMAGMTKSAPVGLSGVPGSSQSFWGLIREPFSGAWQRNMELETRQNITAFSAVYACISLIADDIAKLRIKLMEQDESSAVWSEVRRNSPFLRVLQKPNGYQTRIQFLSYWQASRLLYGNAYILKEREPGRGIVRALYCLDPRLVTPLIADDGSVWYRLNADAISGLQNAITVPASEIIHDRCVTLYHPLVGVSPIFAAGASATQGIRIQVNSERFFRNMSAPSGHLTADGNIQDNTAERLKRDFESAVSGINIGRMLVSGDGIKYQPFTMPAVDAQLIEQLRWTVEDVARCFRVPLHKIAAGQLPQVGNMASLDQAYYSQTLQGPIESVEILLDEGLELDQVPDRVYGTELDLDGLLRMDPLTRADRLEKLMRGSVLSPDEARASENLLPVPGGDSPMAQQQNFSLQALAKRDAKPDPFATTPKPEPTAPVAAPDQSAAKSANVLKFHTFRSNLRKAA